MRKVKQLSWDGSEEAVETIIPSVGAHTITTISFHQVVQASLLVRQVLHVRILAVNF